MGVQDPPGFSKQQPEEQSEGNATDVSPEPEEAPWEAVSSANIGAIRRVNGVTQIRFKDKKTGLITGEYHYNDIPDELHEKFRLADSVGSFFHANIKHHYKGVRQELNDE